MRFPPAYVHISDALTSCRRSDYERTEITVFLLGNSAGGEQAIAPYQHGGENGKHDSIQGERRPAMGLRQSKRIRQSRGRQESARLTVSKSTTVRDMKTMVRGSLLHVPSAS